MPRIALVRRPGPRLSEGLSREPGGAAVDPDLARGQWDHYVDALHTAGWDTIEVPPADDCPDAVFVEDPVVVHDDLAVITRPGAPSRRGESTGVEETLRDLGYRIRHVEAPGILDGGDVLEHGGHVYVGVSTRTNGAGLNQLAEHLAEFGVRVQMITVERALHLKSTVTALPDGTIVGWPPVVDYPGSFTAYRPVAERSGAQLLLLGDNRILMAASAPRTADELRHDGYDVVTVEISEFEKLDGGVTCLSVRLRR